jgi:hypothetical protein
LLASDAGGHAPSWSGRVGQCDQHDRCEDDCHKDDCQEDGVPIGGLSIPVVGACSGDLSWHCPLATGRPNAAAGRPIGSGQNAVWPTVRDSRTSTT